MYGILMAFMAVSAILWSQHGAAQAPAGQTPDTVIEEQVVLLQALGAARARCEVESAREIARLRRELRAAEERAKAAEAKAADKGR